VIGGDNQGCSSIFIFEGTLAVLHSATKPHTAAAAMLFVSQSGRKTYGPQSKPTYTDYDQ